MGQKADFVCVCVCETERKSETENSMETENISSVLLENLLKDFHLLLLQLCHHIHTVCQTLWEGPYIHRHTISIYQQCLSVCVNVFRDVYVYTYI